MNGAFPFKNAAIRVVLALLGVLFDDSHTLDEHLLFLRQHCEDFSVGTLVVTADHGDIVALLHMKIETISHFREPPEQVR